VVFKNNYADYNYGNTYDLWIYEWPVCGDADGDGDVDLADVIYLANYLLKGGTPPPIPKFRCNPDGNDSVNLGNVIYLANYKLKGGSAPHDCENYGH